MGKYYRMLPLYFVHSLIFKENSEINTQAMNFPQYVPLKKWKQNKTTTKKSTWFKKAVAGVFINSKDKISKHTIVSSFSTFTVFHMIFFKPCPLGNQATRGHTCDASTPNTRHHPQPISYLTSIKCSQRLIVPQNQTSSTKHLQAPWRHNSWTEGVNFLTVAMEWKTALHFHLLSPRGSKVSSRLKHSKVFNFIINKKKYFHRLMQ